MHALGLETLTEEQAGPGEEAQRLAAERGGPRRGDYARADELRDRLAEIGFEVRDTPEGPQLVRRT